VHLRRVLDDPEIDTAEAQLLDAGAAVGQETFLVSGIDPGPGDDLGAVVRADVLLVGADERSFFSTSSDSSARTLVEMTDSGSR
jgi:hypothetical protein